MKQKLRILTLSFLLVMQSFFGLAPITLAENSGGTEDEIVVVDEGNNEGNETEEGMEEGETTTGNEPEEGDSSLESDEDEGVTEEDESEAGEGTEETEIPTIERPASTPENELLGGKNGGVGMMSTLPAADFGNDVTFNFDRLVINNTVTIRSPQDAQNYQPQLGETVNIYYTFDIKATQDYGLGSSFNFQLPQALLAFESSTLSGRIDHGDIQLVYTTTGDIVTVTMEEGDLFETQELEDGRLHFVAKFDEIGSNGELEQTLEIPIGGSQMIQLPFTFKPPTSNEPMTKTGSSAILADGTRVMNWTVWVNRKGEKLNSAKVNDVTDGKHELYGNITVEKYQVGLNGVASNPTETSTATSFPVNLANGHFAYKLTYQTEVTAEAITEEVTYRNTATLSGSHSDSATGSATHKFGTKLEKSVTNSNKYHASWGIKYNYFGKKFTGTQTLTDTINGPHKIDPDSVKVYLVTFDIQGNPTVSATETTPASGPTVSTDGKTLTIGLNSQNGQAYYITYDTKHEKDFVTQSSSVSNSVTYTDYGETSKTDGFGISENIFSKSRGSIDYAKKEITWTLYVNAERAMNNLVITDTFTSYAQGGTRQTLINPDGTAVDSKNVAAAFTISNSNVSINNATLQSNDREGFRLELGNIPQGRNFTITYKTKFDLQANGAAYSEYKNTANATWIHPTTDEPFSVPNKTASYTPGNSPTGKNGYKEGSFDHVNQRFNWKLAVNINKQDISGASVVDTIGDGHELVLDSIKVYKLSLDVNQEKGTYNKNLPISEDSNTYTLSGISSKGFTLTFSSSLADNNEAYIITYQTKDENAIIGHEGGAWYDNEAVFTTQSGGEFEFDASAEVKHANELIKKSVEINSLDETIAWTIDVNKSHSALGSITLTDKMSGNQLILPDTFEKRQITMNEEGKLIYGQWQSVTPTTINRAENSFTLDLGSLNKVGYQIKYKTFFLGADNELFSNEASINYAGATTGASKDDKINNQRFVYSSSSGTISSTKGTLEIQKVGVNPLTGEQENLAGITFHLKNLSGTIKLAEATTDAAGKLTFENVRYGKYKLEEIDTPTGYNPLSPNPLDITMDEKIDGKTYVVENIKNVDMSSACEYFTLIVNDVDSEARQGVQVKLVNKNTGVSVTRSTDENGQISIVSTQLPAGPYEAYEVINGQEEKLDDVIVSYEGNCDAKVIQPKPTCSEFTITIVGTDNNPSANVVVTLKHKTDSNAPEISATTDTNGMFTVPNTTKAGIYKVYEGKQYLGTVTVTYKNGCEATVIEAPTCEVFTLIVKDIDGNPREAVEIVVKEKGTDTAVTTVTTDASGQVTITNLKPGEYEVYEDGEPEPFAEFASNVDCSADAKPAPPCEDFTIIVNDVDGVHREGVTITIKDKDGKEVARETTDKNGQITIPTSNLPAGEYEVYEGDVKLADLTVSYKDGCQTVVIQPEPNCDFYTIKNRNLEVGTVVTLKGANNFEEKATVTKAGEVQFASNDLPAGEYEVIIAGELLSNITVSYKNSCSTTIHQLDFEEDGKKTFLEEIITKQQCTPQVQPIKDGKAIGEKRPINKDGVFATEEGEHEFAVTIECEGEEEIVVGKITVDEDGKVKEELIDPYGKITVCVTNEILGGVEVELYYADTQRNRDNGRTPGTLVDLPSLPNFGPNFNANPQVSKYDPQWSDVAGDYATYAWMVHPETDYYIALKKEGYASKISETISVEYDIVKRNFCMEPYSSSGGGGGNSGGDTPGDGNEGGKTPEDGNEGGKTPGDGNEGGKTPGDGNEGGKTPGDGNEGGKTPGDGNEGGKTPGDGKEEGNTPGDGKEEGNTPGDGKEEGNTPGDGDQEGNTPTGGNQDGRPDVGSKDKTTNLNSSDKANLQASEDSLPQTGEERNLLLLFVGITFIMIGAMLISMRRKTKAF